MYSTQEGVIYDNNKYYFHSAKQRLTNSSHLTHPLLRLGTWRVSRCLRVNELDYVLRGGSRVSASELIESPAAWAECEFVAFLCVYMRDAMEQNERKD